MASTTIRTLTAAALFALTALAASPSAADDSDDFFGDAPQSAPKGDAGDFFGDAPVKASFAPTGSLSGELWEKFSVDTVKDTPDEYLYSSLSLLLAEGTFNVSPSLSAKLSALASWQAWWNAEDYEGNDRVEVREGYATWRAGPVDVQIGQQYWAWGLTDVIAPTDLINPIDLTRFLDAEMSLSRLPVPSVGATWYFRPLRLTGVYLPFFNGMRFGVAGSGDAIFGRVFPTDEFLRFVKDDAGYHDLKRFLDHWVPDWEQDLTDAFSDPELWDARIEEPEDDFTNGSGAVRLGGSAGGYDFDVMGYYLWDQIPTLYLNPQLRKLLSVAPDSPEDYGSIPRVQDLSVTLLTDPFRARYHRVAGPGADFGTTLGPVSVRTEGVALFGRRTYQEDLTPVEKPIYNWAFNLEYTLPGDITLSGVLFQSHIGDYERELLMEPVTSIVFVGWRATYFQDRFKTEGAFAYDLSYLDRDDWREGRVFDGPAQLSPVVEWAWTDNLRTSLGANLVYGPRFSLFGLFREKSRVFASVKYAF